MKRSFFRMMALVLCAVLLFGACGGKKKVADGPEDTGLYNAVGEFPIAKEPMELTFFSQDVPAIIDLETNKFTQYLEDKTNIKVVWELTPQDGVETNLNLLLASDDYPDVFYGLGIKGEILDKYGGPEKVFLPLNNLIDEQMPNFQKVLQEYPGIDGELRSEDGNIYSFPSMNEYTHVRYAQKMWMNTDWLETLNLDMPTTTDELYTVLKAFKEQDPNGNGKADEIPLAGSPNTGGGWHSGIDNFIMNAFIYDSGYYQSDLRPYIHKGAVDVAVNKEEYKEGLKFLRKLYSEGLIYEASFTQNNEQLMSLALNPDDVILGAAPSGHPAMFIPVDNERYRQYDAVPPLKGPNGAQFVTRWDDLAEHGEYAISTQCATPILAARLADAYYDYEVQMNRKWGPEGESWRVAEEGELGLGGDPALYKVLEEFDESAQNDAYTWLGIEFVPAELMEGMTVTPKDVDLHSAEGFEKLLLERTNELYIPYETEEYLTVPNALRYTEDEAEERNTLRINLENLVKESRVQFITGEKDIDAEWDSFISSLDEMGLQEFLEIDNAAYARYVEASE